MFSLSKYTIILDVEMMLKRHTRSNWKVHNIHIKVKFRKNCERMSVLITEKEESNKR